MDGILDALTAEAEHHPAHRAIRDLSRDLTYAELLEDAERVASGLAVSNVGEGDRVVILIPNSVDFVVAALACLWVGAAFVPLSPADPHTRLAGIITDCKPALVILPDPAGESPPAPQFPLIESRTLSALWNQGTLHVDRVSDASRVAYVIYTSGTTGAPKGVQISNSAFWRAVRSARDALGLTSSTTTLCVSPFHFDGSYANLFPTLAAGGSVVIRPRDALLFARTFINAVVKEKVTYAGFTVSYLRLLLASPQIENLRDSTLRVIALGGEAVNAADLEALWSVVPSMKVFNRYGPTETTIAVTHVELTRELIVGRSVPIGAPHPDVSFFLLGEDGEVIEEPYRPGELYIGGGQLMVGYLGAPELTASVLRRDVISGETVYRTGDLVYRDDRGLYVYVDRVDRVVKRSGVRISLVELNEVLNKLPGVLGAACITYDDEGELGIVAFIISDRPSPSALELRRLALRQLPETMLPNRFEFVESFPLNRSNKLDERALLAKAGLTQRGHHAAQNS